MTSAGTCGAVLLYGPAPTAAARLLERASLEYPFEVTAFSICSEFVVPRSVDVGHPAHGDVRSDPDATLETVRHTIEENDRLTLVSITSSNPSFFVCVSVHAPNEDSAASYVQQSVHAALMDVIPGAIFVKLAPTNPDWRDAGLTEHPHGQTSVTDEADSDATPM